MPPDDEWIDYLTVVPKPLVRLTVRTWRRVRSWLRRLTPGSNVPDRVTASAATIPPGTPPPKITAEVWDGADQYPYAKVVDVVRIDDTWHVVVTLDD